MVCSATTVCRSCCLSLRCLVLQPEAQCCSWLLACLCVYLPVWCAQVKENICKEGFVVDKDDNSLTRSNTYMLELFRKAGMSVQ